MELRIVGLGGKPAVQRDRGYVAIEFIQPEEKCLRLHKLAEALYAPCPFAGKCQRSGDFHNARQKIVSEWRHGRKSTVLLAKAVLNLAVQYVPKYIGGTGAPAT